MIAKERNIDYTPTQESQAQLLGYCTRKGLQPPIEIIRAPIYVPLPQPIYVNAVQAPTDYKVVDSNPSVYMPYMEMPQ